MVRVTVPKGFGARANLSVDGLSSMERDAAWATEITVEGKKLPCRSFRKAKRGGYDVLFLEVEAGHFEIVEK